MAETLPQEENSFSLEENKEPYTDYARMEGMRKKTTPQLKKQLDKLFSEYIRRKYSDGNGMALCYTCQKYAHWKELQCGHFVSRAQLATRFSEDNCRVQCAGCNIFGGGRISIFAERLEKELGDGSVARLYQEGNKITKDFPYEERISHYEEEIKKLDEAHTVLLSN